MMHGPCRCDVAARTGPGVLWWGKAVSGKTGRPHPCVSPPCPWKCLLSRPAERCRRMCREPCLEWGECLFTAHRRMVVYSVCVW
eukprot:5333850-Prymnesium_polylepis.1